MTLDALIIDLARKQHGVIARRQLVAAGHPRGSIERRVRRGLLEPMTPRVFAAAAATDSRGRRAMTAILDVGDDVILSHASAAAWWRISGFRLDPIHVSVQRNRRWHRRPGTVVHHATVIPAEHVTVLDGLPIARPALTLLQLAGTLPYPRLAAAIDNAWSLRLIDRLTLQEVLDRMARPGRNGIVNFRDILEKRPDDWSPPHSNLESRFLHLNRVHALGRFDAQVVLRDGEWKARVDFLECDVPLVIEIQSQRYHAAMSHRARDEARRQRIEALGYTVVEIWDEELFHDEAAVADRVRSVRRELLQRSVAAG